MRIFHDIQEAPPIERCYTSIRGTDLSIRSSNSCWIPFLLLHTFGCQQLNKLSVTLKYLFIYVHQLENLSRNSFVQYTEWPCPIYFVFVSSCMYLVVLLPWDFWFARMCVLSGQTHHE